MEQNSSFTPRNDYEGINPLDKTPQHPNKYELIEKRAEQIDNAINSIFKNSKDEARKRPVVGITTLVRRELQKQGGVILKSEEEENNFAAEYNTDAIVAELCKIVGYDDKNNYDGLKDAIDAYLK